ncbi:MAG: PspC domain-containing protein [Bacteroidetes bacterium]|nr:PspC domain-containing protein [Bacteroidota bacterium]
MNKTVTINISGIIFHIEEDAFEKLSKYLGTIKGYFSRTEGGNEIMSDIEARIAEMLQTKINAVKQVVLMADVDAVIETMGRPEEFAGEEEPLNNTQPAEEEVNETGKKRMFRDPDHKAVAGVCSGIAAYFDVDVVWVRLAMFLLIFFGGVSLWVYIILWIVIPEAKTTADKLAMRGERIDINNISKTVKEEAEQVKKRMEKYGKDFITKDYSQPKNFFDKLANFIKDFFVLFGNLFGRVIGFILLTFGMIFMFVLLSTIFGFSVMGSNTEYNDWVNLFFIDRSHYTLGMLGIILCFGVPVLMMIYGGIKLLFKIHYSNRWLNLSAGLIWFIGFVIALFIGITTGKDFGNGGKIKEQVQLQQHDTLYLTLNRDKQLLASLNLNAEDDYNSHGEIRFKRHNSDYLIGKNPEKFFAGYATLNVVPSLTDNFELYIIKEARGEDRRAASERAKVISYKVVQKDSVISFDELFTVPATEKFRVQEIHILLKVPRGKVIHLDKNLASFISDVENVTNTFDSEMVNRRWVMTKEGLECIDCEGLEVNEDEHDLPAPPLPPGTVDVDSKDANVKINKDGIKIKSKDGDVNIDKDGIHIETKDKQHK